MRNQSNFYISTNLLAGHSWKFMCVQAIISMLLGLIFILNHKLAPMIFAILLGLMLLGSGIQGFVLMARQRRFKLWYALYSLFWFLAGLLFVVEPFLTATALIITLGIWFILHAVELFVAAAIDRIHTRNFRILVALNGALTLLFGILIAGTPVGAIAFFNCLFASYLIFYGAVTLAVALRFRRIVRKGGEVEENI